MCGSHCITWVVEHSLVGVSICAKTKTDGALIHYKRVAIGFLPTLANQRKEWACWSSPVQGVLHFACGKSPRRCVAVNPRALWLEQCRLITDHELEMNFSIGRDPGNTGIGQPKICTLHGEQPTKPYKIAWFELLGTTECEHSLSDARRCGKPVNDGHKGPAVIVQRPRRDLRITSLAGCKQPSAPLDVGRCSPNNLRCHNRPCCWVLERLGRVLQILILVAAAAAIIKKLLP
jgi:hypothetical protein